LLLPHRHPHGYPIIRRLPTPPYPYLVFYETINKGTTISLEKRREMYVIANHGKFRSGASASETKAAAQMLQERLINPTPGIKLMCAVADIGGGAVHVIADLAEQETGANIERTLQFRSLPAVENITWTPVVDAKEALAVYLKMK
jgi:hypothetical protein